MSDHAGHPRAPDAGHAAAHDPHAPTAAPQAENLPIAKVVTVGVVAILVFTVGSVWALRIRSATLHAMNPTGAASIPASLGAEEQGMVDQIPFDLNHWVKDDRETNAARINSYGWVDRQAGTIHIPIRRAMELQLEQPSAPAQSPEKPAPQEQNVQSVPAPSPQEQKK